MNFNCDAWITGLSFGKVKVRLNSPMDHEKLVDCPETMNCDLWAATKNGNSTLGHSPMASFNKSSGISAKIPQHIYKVGAHSNLFHFFIFFYGWQDLTGGKTWPLLSGFKLSKIALVNTWMGDFQRIQALCITLEGKTKIQER